MEIIFFILIGVMFLAEKFNSIFLKKYVSSLEDLNDLLQKEVLFEQNQNDEILKFCLKIMIQKYIEEEFFEDAHKCKILLDKIEKNAKK